MVAATSFIPFKQYLAKNVSARLRRSECVRNENCCEAFRFIIQLGPSQKIISAKSCDQLGAVADLCAKNGLVFGLEVEANLVGQTGKTVGGDPSQGQNITTLSLIFDGANLVCQGMTPDQSVW